MEDPGIVDAQSARPLGVHLQVEAPEGGGMVTHVEGADGEGMDPQ